MKLHRIVHDRVHHGNNNLIILTNCARLLKHIPQKKHKLETNKHKQLIPFTETCQKPPRVLNHFFRHR